MEGGTIIQQLSKEKLEKINGGGITFWTVAGIVALGTFIIGVFDGIARPEKCG